MKPLGRVGAGFDGIRFAGFGHNKDQQRHFKRPESANKLATGRIPCKEHADAPADRRNPVEHQVFKFAERLVGTGAHGREDFEHLFGVRQPASGGEAIGLVSNKQQIQKRLLDIDGAGEGGGNGHGFLESLALGIVDKRVEHQRVPDEELVFEFPDDRFACFGPTAPVDVPQGIAAAILPKRHELVALPDVRRESDAALLVFHVAGQGNGGESIASGQDEQRLRERVPGEPVNQPERIRARQGHALVAVSTVPAGETTTTIYGLNVNYDYCFTVAAVWSSEHIVESERTCTRRTTVAPSVK